MDEHTFEKRIAQLLRANMMDDPKTSYLEKMMRESVRENKKKKLQESKNNKKYTPGK